MNHDADLDLTWDAFHIDSSMSPAQIEAAIADLAAAVELAAHEANDLAERAGDPEMERRADALEDALAELENITFEADQTCPVCMGTGVVGASVQCPRCAGHGDVPSGRVTQETVDEIKKDVAAARKELR